MGLSPRVAGLVSPPPVLTVLGGKPKPATRGVLLVKSLRQDQIDPRTEFLKCIDLTKTRVRSFEGFILLCGGPQDVDLAPLKSLRHMLYGEIVSGKHSHLAARLKLAEEIQDWFKGDLYKDLVTFEEHLAGLSAVIVLVVESAGAIAELGAFSVSSAFTDRVLVVVPEHHYDQESFIRLGPLKRLEDNNQKSVMVYDWHSENHGRYIEELEKVRADVPEIISAINSYTRSDIGEQVFRPSLEAHVMLLICELCDLFGALSQMEIQNYLKYIGININEHQVQQYIFVLSKCDLLGTKSKGHGRYYHPIDWKSRISFSFHPGSQFNRERLRSDVLSYYSSNLRSRFEVIQKIMVKQ